MNQVLAFEWPFSESVVERLGWVLVHSFWQFALVALLAGVTVRALRRNSATTRYSLLVVAMAVAVAAPVATWLLVRIETPPEFSASRAAAVIELESDVLMNPGTGAAPFSGGLILASDSDPEVPVTDYEAVSMTSQVPSDMPMPSPERMQPVPSLSERIQTVLRPWLAWIVTVWGLGVVLCSARPLLGWHTLRSLRRVGTSPVSVEVQAALTHVSKRIGLRHAVQVLQSTLAQVPIVVGYFRPVILLPISLVTNLPAAQLETILAHELVHVRRHDFVVNLLQTLVETLFFYHPAVWWLSHRIRVEREHCCDDQVVKLLGNRVEYGRALVAIEQLRGGSSVLALSAADGSLLSRVRRIVGLNTDLEGKSPWPALSLVACCFGAVLATSVFGWSGQAETGNASRQTESVPAAVTDSEESTDVSRDEPAWGEVTNGLRARVVPVRSSMSEDAIDSTQRVEKFEKAEDVAFAVEMENVSDKAIKLLDTRYGGGYGGSKGKADSNWFGQFLFSIDLFDGNGKKIERPEVQVIDLDRPLRSALVVTLEPGNTQRFLLRPAKWLSAMTQRITPGSYRAAVRYQGLPSRVATRTKEYRPDNSVLATVAGQIVSPQVPFEVLPAHPSVQPTLEELVWGEPSKGLRAALSFMTHQASYAHGERPAINLHLQNFTRRPITLLSKLSLPNAMLTAKNSQDEPVAMRAVRLLGRRLLTRITLKPKQTVVIDAGYLGLAITKARAAQFKARTPRKFVAPAGKYSLQLATHFGNVLRWESGKEKVIEQNVWVGELKTGATPLTITNEKIKCDIVDAVTGKPIADTTTSFHFIKPKTADAKETTISNLVWGPKGPGHIYFQIPEQVMQRADREELEVQWGTGNHPDYENYSPAERIPLKPFFHEGTKAAREILSTIKLTPKKKVTRTAPPKGLEFLTSYPKLHGLSLDMTETQFLEIVKQQQLPWRVLVSRGDVLLRIDKQQDLKTFKTVESDKVSHHIALGDGHTLIVMFDKDAKCKGIQRVRSDDLPVGVQTLRKPAFRLPGHSNIRCVGYDNKSKELVVVSTYHVTTIRRWDMVDKKLMSEITLSSDKHLRPFREGTFKLSGDRRRVIGATDEFVGIWDTATGELLKKLPFATKDGIYDCAIGKLDCTPDLSVIAGHWTMPGRLTLFYDAHVIVWDGASGKVLQTVIDKHATTLHSIDLSKDGKLLATTNGGGAKVWETSTGKLLRSFPNDNTGRKHSDPEVSKQYTSHVWSVQISPDSNQLVVGDILGVRIWDVSSGELRHQLDASYRYSNGNATLAFSKDGQLLARTGTWASNKERTVPIWSTQSGEKLFELHSNPTSGTFSDDNKQFVVGLSDWRMALAVFQLSGRVADTAQPPPEPTKDKMQAGSHHRGKKAEEFIDNWNPVWGKPQLGIQYGVALTTQRRQFRVGERVPLAVFFRNVSDRPQQLDQRPDFFWNTPQVVNANGEAVTLARVALLGTAPHYRDKLEPGEAFGPLYVNFGLGENPRPGRQNWAPYWKAPAAGHYTLTHKLAFKVAVPGIKSDETSDDWKGGQVTSGTLEFKIVEGGKSDADEEAAALPTEQGTSLADAVRQFNAENKKCRRRLENVAPGGRKT
jgi:beta-lactamase regulating signal transducer with metallopeptidase domain/WD40 repeat protein